MLTTLPSAQQHLDQHDGHGPTITRERPAQQRLDPPTQGCRRPAKCSPLVLAADTPV
ncbi:hypothetical protein [Calidifontibacter indicus]|uniref:hypothetical protein n=1 Tax=Calidifontibacter indicus TaxID=419650 RepID=UPI001473E8CA|nr:hypothetical protein [Calidifontibacter indicus]